MTFFKKFKIPKARIFLVLTLLASIYSYSQTTSFQRVDSVQVKVSNSILKNAWAGGLNFCQLSAIDLDQDGIKDLFVFDKTGNKISTFINGGKPNTIDYKHAPEYRDKFPQLKDWALLVDYNCDSKEDIFTSSIYGIAVYTNTSTIADGLKFTKLTDIVLTRYTSTGGTINIYVPTSDIPAIVDMDNDGDIDIATMNPSGFTMEYHENRSMQFYGNCDSLDFIRSSACWGEIFESFGNNDIALNVSCKGEDGYKTEHGAGSSELCFDMDGDGDKEMFVGMLGYFNYHFLHNGGDSLVADITYGDKDFPSYDASVNLNSFPSGFYLDVNNDGAKDLVVCPSSPFISENFTSVLFYENMKTADSITFQFQQNDLLQNEMIETGEGAYPAIVDYNTDGLTDIVIGNYGYTANLGFYTPGLSLYENTGSAADPKFELITRDYLNLSQLGLLNLCPAFGDMDGDNDEDLMIGDKNGHLQYYRNTAGAGNTCNFSLAEANYVDSAGVLIDVGQFATPQIIDVNRDGKKDLIIGNQTGKITYYENRGSTTSPAFTNISSNLGKVDVTINGFLTGYSYPCLYDDGGSYKLVVGSENGHLYYYDNIDGHLADTFNLVSSTYQNIWEGVRTAPTAADMNNDGYLDMLVGNYAGGLAFYYGSNSSSVHFSEQMVSFDVFPNPASVEINIRLRSEKKYADQVIKIVDLLGREVMSRALEQQSIDISNLSPGLYDCQLILSDGEAGESVTANKKLVVCTLVN